MVDKDKDLLPKTVIRKPSLKDSELSLVNDLGNPLAMSDVFSAQES